MAKAAPAPSALTNADIAHHLAGLAQLMAAQSENPFKVKAYRRAADTLRGLGVSVAELVRNDADLTQYPGIGPGLSRAIRELVESGSLRQLEALRSEVAPEVAALSAFPRLDPKLVLRAYEALGVSSVEALRTRLETGEVGQRLGPRVEQHFRRALIPANAILLYDADALVPELERHLTARCGMSRVELAGEVRRRVEVVSELSFLVATPDFARGIEQMQRFGGGTELVAATAERASFRLTAGIVLTLHHGRTKSWGRDWILATGSEAHLAALEARGWGNGEAVTATTEAACYRRLGLRLIPPELREGNGEVELAAAGKLPELVTVEDLRGELHAHSTSSDGAHTIEQMVAAARKRGYAYLGITDHSQSLKIAGGVSIPDLRRQLAHIDALNARLRGFRVLKSAEVDILADGSLDYPDEVLRELDYTVCSIHSRFGLGREAQTGRILRAMDNPCFNLLGHATGRLLLRRPGYALDVERIIAKAREVGAAFEINASPDRLDLSAEHARLAHAAGVPIAICTDAHSVTEFDFTAYGVNQARRAGLPRSAILNCLPWPALQRALRRH